MSATLAGHTVPSGSAAIGPGPAAPGVALIVEDNDTVGPLLELLVGQSVPRTVLVASATECLRWFEAHQDEVLLAVMDCGLPDGHGGSLAHRLRQRRPGLPLLVTSGRPQPEVVRLLAADGPTDFLPKPFRAAELGARVRELLAVGKAA